MTQPRPPGRGCGFFIYTSKIVKNGLTQDSECRSLHPYGI